MKTLECQTYSNNSFRGLNCISLLNESSSSSSSPLITTHYECFKTTPPYDFNVFKCYQDPSIFTGYLNFIPLMHKFIIPFSFFYSLYDKKVFSSSMTIWFIFFNFVLSLMQLGFKIDRPYLDCVSSFFSTYSFPNKEVILVNGNIISILYYSQIISRLYKKRQRNEVEGETDFQKKKRRGFKYRLVCCGSILVRFYGFLIIILLGILHPLSMYLLKLSSGPHILLSLVFGGFFNLMVCLCVGYIMKYLYENKNDNNNIL